MKETLPLLYHDDRIVAVNKPAGLLVHRSFIDRKETVFAMQLLRDQLGQRVYPLHRLDKATSGVLVFALDPETAGQMTGLFTSGLVRKSYLAVVRGYTGEQGRIDHALRVLRDRMTDQRADPDKPAQEAVTEYRRLATVELPQAVGRYATARFSLLRADPHTGRMHQVRRHLKHIFHPVIGDTTYGDGKQNAFFRANLGCRRMLLHASETVFVHPRTGGQVRVLAPLDREFGLLLHRLGWQEALPAGLLP